jgi:DNA-binding transcriptional MerR regulator
MTELTIPQACKEFGISGRSLEHWISRGYLHVPRTGRGHARLIDESEQEVLAILVRLLACGFRRDRAALLARRVRDHTGHSLALPGGVRLHLDPHNAPALTKE